MSDFPKPPSLPLGSQKMLAELVDYYRQLVEYHERAAGVAREEYNYAKALLETNSVALGENRQNTLFPEGSDYPRGSGNSDQGHHFPTLHFPVSSARLNSVGGLQSEAKKCPPYQDMGTKEAIARVLEANRGMMLRVDYIIREIFGELEEPAYVSATALVNSLLSEGESEDLWYSVSDSPGCYTFSLEDFPDLDPSNRPHRKTSMWKSSHRSRLPYSEKLEHMALHEAVASVLEANYPKVMTAPEILAIFYPEGLKGQTRTLARQAISNALTKGSGSKGWRRIRPGRYIWEAGSS
ncbi:MAG: hypothetical protein F6K58_02450 [Symploca sp. SIO2E9]|nr:hypothetical protein [Symploca sp. SIO2E9]